MMARPATRSRPAEAAIRQLCCLGLNSQVVMPAVFRELHTLLPAFGYTFFWADRQGRLANLYDESLADPSAAALYMAEFYNRREGEVMRHPFTASMRRERGLYTLDGILKVDRGRFFRSDLYNLVWRPLGYHDTLRLVLREGGHPVRALHVWRRAGERPFTARDEAQLARIAPFLAHTAGEAAPPAGPLAESEEAGVVVADRAGRIQHLSPEARRLLVLARSPRVDAPGRLRVELPPEVVGLCHRLTAVFEGGQAEGPPVWFHRNGWGGFTFRAHWLEGPEGPLIGVTVRRREPLAVRLVRQARLLGLPARQIEYAVLAAAGHDNDAIARRMGVSRETALTHRRRLYARLEAHDRAQMLARLLEMEASPPPASGRGPSSGPQPGPGAGDTGI